MMLIREVVLITTREVNIILSAVVNIISIR